MTATAAVAPIDSLWLQTPKTRRHTAKPTSPRQRRDRTQLHAPAISRRDRPRYARLGEISGLASSAGMRRGSVDLTRHRGLTPAQPERPLQATSDNQMRLAGRQGGY